MQREIIENKVNEIFEKLNLVKNLAHRKGLTKFIMCLFSAKNIYFSDFALHIVK